MTQRMALVLSFVFGCISASSTVPIVGDTTVCAGAWPVSLRAPTNLAPYLWSTGETTSEIFITRPGTYTVIVMRANGPDTTRITVRELPLPVPKLDSFPVYICRGQSLAIQPTSTFKFYLWSTGERTQSIRIDTAGYFRVTVTDTNGCVGTSDSMQVIVFDRPKPTITGPYTVCKDSLSLYETENITGATYSWNAVGGIVQAGQGLPTVRIRWPGGSGSVELRVSIKRPDGGICDTLVRLPVRVGPQLQPLLSYKKQMFCDGDSTVLDAGGGFNTYSWSNGLVSRTIVVKTPGTYWADVMDATGCVGRTDTVNVVVFPLPDVRILGDTSLCNGETIQLTALAVANDVVQWQWSNGFAQRTIFVTTPGIYTVVGRTANGCIDSASTTILPAAQASILAPDSLDFDSLEMVSARFLPFVLENRTAQLIRVLSARLASGRTNPSLSVPTLPDSIPGLGAMSFVLAWLADIEGPFVDTLLIEIDGPECPSTVRIPIRGYRFFRPVVPISISIGDTVVPVGTVLDMLVHIRATAPREEFVDFEFSVRWNNRVFRVTGLDNASVISDQTLGAERTVRYRLSPVRFPIDTTFTLHGTVLLGSPLQTDLIPDSVSITSSKSIYTVTTDPGHIAMTGCFIASRLVLFIDVQPLAVITNMLGETLTCDVDALPSGSYMITTITGTTVYTQRILVVR